MTESTESHEGIKQCPYCAEDIKAEAVKCKHCGEWLDERRDSPRVEPDGGSRGQTNRKAPFIPRWATEAANDTEKEAWKELPV